MFNKVIGPNGLLANKTRIFVTHKVSILPQTDEIIVLKDGKIAERGSFEELVKKESEFTKFIVEHIMDHKEEHDDLSESITDELLESITESLKSILIESSASIKSINKNLLSKNESKMSKNNDEGKLIEKEVIEEGSIKLQVYKKYIQVVGWKILLLIFIGFLFSNVFSFLTSLWLEQWSNDAYDLAKLNDTSNKINRITVYGLLGIGEILILMMSSLILGFFCVKGSMILHNNMLVRILHSPMSFFGMKIIIKFLKDV